MRAVVQIVVLIAAILAGAGRLHAQAPQAGWFGVKVQTVTPQVMAERNLSVPFGAIVVEIEAGSPAQTAGVRLWDVLIAVGTKRISTAEDLYEVLAGLAPDAVMDLALIRGGQTAKVAVTIGNRPDTARINAPRLMLDTGGHMGLVRGVLFTADGNQIVSTSQDKVVRVWDWRRSMTVRTIRGNIGPGEEGKILTIALSPDNKWLAVAGLMSARSTPQDLEAGAIRVYEFASGELKALLKGHTNAVRSLVFSSDGRLLLSGAQDNTAIVWDFPGLRRLHTLSGHAAEVYSVALSPDATKAVTGSLDGTARLWNTADGALIEVLKGHTGRVRSVAINPVDGTIASGGDDGEIRLWHGGTGRFEKVLTRNVTQVWALTFSPDGKQLLSGVGDLSPDRDSHVYDVATGSELVRYSNHDNIVVATGISPDGKLAVTGGGNRNEIHVWELVTGKRIGGMDGKPIALGGGGTIVFATGFASDNRTLRWGKVDPCPSDTSCPHLMGKLQWQLRLPVQGEEIGRPESLSPQTNDTQRAVLANAGHKLALRAGGAQNKPDAILEIHDKDGGTLASVERGQRDGYRHSAFTFTPDGQTVVSGGSVGVVTAYDLAGNFKGTLLGHDDDIAAVSPSPDGRFLVSGSADQTVRLWNAGTWELVVTLYHGDDGQWVMWTPQGFYTGSPGGGGLVGWQINNGPDKAADYITGEQLRKTLHRPDIVEKAIILGSAKAAVDEAYPAGFDLAKLLEARPPRLTIVSPPSGEWATGGHVLLTVRIDTSQPLRSVDIYVGGRKVAAPISATQGGRREVGRITRTYRVPLAEGANDVAIVAANDAGSTPLTSNSLLAWHRGEGALDLRGTLYVLAIGVNQYKGLPRKCGKLGDMPCDLEYAGADANLFLETVTQELGPAHVKTVPKLLINGAGPKNEPTRQNIRTALQALKGAGQRDTIMVMVAAHGEQAANGRYFILPTDIRRRPTDRLGTGSNILDWSELQAAVVGFGRRLLFIDACHAGRALSARAYNSKIRADAHAERFVVFSATSPDQFAEENALHKHGLFTYFLAAGIRGDALDSSEHVVRVYRLGDYLSTEVRRVTDGRQEPEFYSGMGNFILLRK